METVQMNTRIGAELKRSGDAVLRRNGYSPTAAVKALWEYVSAHNALPAFMPKRAADEGKERQAEALRADEGLACRLFADMTGLPLNLPLLDGMSDDELRQAEWAARGALDG